MEKVFLFCFDLERHRKWARQHNKIKLVDDKIETIIKSIERDDYILSYLDVAYK